MKFIYEQMLFAAFAKKNAELLIHMLSCRQKLSAHRVAIVFIRRRSAIGNV